jgi:hypothetical protein
MAGSSHAVLTLYTVFLDDTVAPVGRRPAHLTSQSPPVPCPHRQAPTWIRTVPDGTGSDALACAEGGQ